MGIPLNNRRWRSGGACVASGLALNQWTIGYLFSADGTVDNPISLAGIWFVDIVLVSVGLSLLLRHRPIDWKRAGFKLSAVVLSLLVVELLLWAITFIVEYGHDKTDPRSRLSPYQGKAWAGRLFDEIRDIEQAKQFQRHPFLGWDMKEYHGQYINVGSDGCRKTWNPPCTPGKHSSSVYVLGGSTVWGIGERDDYTIPSCLSRMLYDGGYDYVVRNYGDVAYTFTQELINLILLLKEGHRPAYVIFYDGANDVYGSYRTGVSGSLLDPLGLRDDSVTRKRPIEHFWLGVSGLLAKYSKIYQYMSKITTVMSSSPQFPEVGATYSDEQLRYLAEGVVEDYATSQSVLDHLAKAYGFEYLTFWQPVTLLEDHLFDEEKTDIRVGDAALARLHKYVRRALDARTLPNHYDLSDTFRDRTTTVYVDYCHLSEEGNALVATRIYEIVEPKLKRRRVPGDATEPGQIQKP